MGTVAGRRLGAQVGLSLDAAHRPGPSTAGPSGGPRGPPALPLTSPEGSQALSLPPALPRPSLCFSPGRAPGSEPWIHLCSAQDRSGCRKAAGPPQPPQPQPWVRSFPFRNCSVRRPLSRLVTGEVLLRARLPGEEVSSSGSSVPSAVGQRS